MMAATAEKLGGSRWHGIPRNDSTAVEAHSALLSGALGQLNMR